MSKVLLISTSSRRMICQSGTFKILPKPHIASCSFFTHLLLFVRSQSPFLISVAEDTMHLRHNTSDIVSAGQKQVALLVSYSAYDPQQLPAWHYNLKVQQWNAYLGVIKPIFNCMLSQLPLRITDCTRWCTAHFQRRTVKTNLATALQSSKVICLTRCVSAIVVPRLWE